jgi:hypothetical protein
MAPLLVDEDNSWSFSFQRHGINPHLLDLFHQLEKSVLTTRPTICSHFKRVRCVLLAIEPSLIPTDGPKVPHQHCLLQDSIQ